MNASVEEMCVNHAEICGYGVRSNESMLSCTRATARAMSASERESPITKVGFDLK